MKIVFLGATKYSNEMLQCLLNNAFDVKAVFMIPKEFDLKKRGEDSSKEYANSNFSDIGETAHRYCIPCYVVDSKEGRTLGSYASIIREISPDIILVLGWYYMVPKSIRELAVHGAFGIHASLLPEYAGGSPLVWAIIRGETRTGITMFRFEDGVDDGDVLAQKEIEIDRYDTIGSLYEKVTVASKDMLVDQLKLMAENKHKLAPQDKSKLNPFPIRTPDDGLVDWNSTDLQLYNFVRAQTRPYPCAFSYINGDKLKLVSMHFPDKTITIDKTLLNGEIVDIDSEVYVKVTNNLVKIDLVEVGGENMEFRSYCLSNSLIGKVFSNN